MNSKTIRVILVDDHTVVRAGIRALLNEVEDMEVVGEAANGRMAIELVESLSPDVVLMDLVMPEVDGIQAIVEILGANPAVKILALTSFSSDDKLFPAIKAGALGYLLKDSSPKELIDAIRRVNRGESSLHPRIARKVLRELSSGKKRKSSSEKLTVREREVLELIALGLTNQEISEQLFVCETTVRTHTSNILGKLHLANRVQAALYAIREGVATFDGQLNKQLP